MTPPAKPDLAATLARLRERFFATSGAVVEAFLAVAARLRRDPGDVTALEDLRQAAHRTHGTAGSYGFHAAGRLAASLEVVSMAWIAAAPAEARAGAHATDRRARIIERFAALLRAAFDGTGSPERRLLLVDLPDAVLATIAAEALHRGLAAERVAAGALAAAIGNDPDVLVVAGEDATLPALDDRPAVAVVRLASDVDPLSAVSACFGSSP